MKIASSFHQVTCVIKNELKASFFQSKPTFESVTWIDAMNHIQEKMSWESDNQKLSMSTILLSDLLQNGGDLQTDVLILIDIDEIEEKNFKILRNLEVVKNSKAVVQFNCTEKIKEIENYGAYDPNSSFERILACIDQTFDKKGERAKQRQVLTATVILH